MNRIIWNLSIGLMASLTIPMFAMAEQTHHQFGISSYMLSLDGGSVTDGSNTLDLTTDASGLAAFYTATFNQHIGMKATLYWLNVDSISDISVSEGDVNGFEGQLLLGANLNQPGFKVYVAPGLYSEDVSFGNASSSFEGYQLGAGAGYNWSALSLDLWLNWRDSSEYEDLLREFAPASIEGDIEVTAISAGLGLSVRF